MRRKAFSYWEFVIVLSLLTIVTAVSFLIGWRNKLIVSQSTCQGNLKQINLAFKQYVQDYDGKFPLVNSAPRTWPVRKGNMGWMDIIQPYIKAMSLFQCPADKSGSVWGNIDYFYNARLAGQKAEKLPYTANTILIGDGTPDLPSNASLSQFPATWASDFNSPAYRHSGGANYIFTDGHAEWLKPTYVTNEKASPTVYTFALR